MSRGRRSVWGVGSFLAVGCLFGCGGSGGGAPIGAGQPSHLVILEQPTEGQARRPMSALRVALVDDNGNVMVAEPASVAIAIDQGPTGGVLSGTSTAAAVDGVAEFTDLSASLGGSYSLSAFASGFQAAPLAPVRVEGDRLHVVLMIADGWGYKQIEAMERYNGRPAVHADWTAVAMSTWSLSVAGYHGGVGYDPTRAWTSLTYLVSAVTDSAAAATAMYSGQKTVNGRVAVDGPATTRLSTLPEHAAAAGLGVGAVSTVPITHATPAVWLAHNESRANYYAIADEMLWGHPNTTGSVASDPRYGGGFGLTALRADAILGGGHPGWSNELFLTSAMRDKLFSESGLAGNWKLVERIAGSGDAAARLVTAATDVSVTRLIGLFGEGDGSVGHRFAGGGGGDPENPTLAEMTRAALSVLDRRAGGFFLLVEGGAVDWAGHFNDMDWSIGELNDFEDAVDAVAQWVADPGNGSNWDNTIVVVTSDHETGLLSAGPGSFPDASLGEVSPRTLALEKRQFGSDRRASWEDVDGDAVVDPGETVYWAWNTGGHSNSLVPLFARGRDADGFANRAHGVDPVRGGYLDNVDLAAVILELLHAPR